MRASTTYAMSTAAGAIGTVAGTIDHPKPRSTSTSATPAWTLHASRPVKRMLASPLIDHQPCHKHGQPDVRRDHDERRSTSPPRHGSRGREQQHGYGRRHPLEAWCQEQVEEKRAGHYRSCQYHLRARRSYATEREQDTHDHGRPPKDHGDKWHSVDHAFIITVVRGAYGVRLSDQGAKDRADDEEREEDAACRNGKESKRERSEREHVTCDRRHETKPDHDRNKYPVADRVPARANHDPRKQAGEADIAARVL